MHKMLQQPHNSKAIAIATRWEEFESMSRPLVLFCRSGNRSGQALMFLASKGIEDGMNGGGASDVMIHKM